MKITKNCVLILAAGKGSRLKSDLPKVLHKILDKAIIDYIVESVLSAGVDPENIGVLVGSGGELVENHIHENFPAVKILWQHEQSGTGHAVKSALDWWKNYDRLIVLNGDVPLITSQSIHNLISENNSCTVATFIAKNPAAYGRIIRDNNKISIVEFKDASEEQRKIQEVNAGLYSFDVKSLEKILPLIKNDNAQKEYYITDALGLMNENDFSTGALILPEDETSGINNQYELAKVNKIMRKRISLHWFKEGVTILDPDTVYISPDAEIERDVTIMPDVQIWGRTKISQGALIGSGSILTNATIGRNVHVIAYAVIENSELKENSKVGPFCYIRENSCLEKNSFAGKFVELKNSRIGENSKVPHLSYMGDATLGHDVNIGAGSITCNYDGKNKNKTFIGDNCFVGSDTMFVAPVELGDGAATAAGSVITQKIPENSLGVGRARQINISDWSLIKNPTLRKSQSKGEN